MLLWALAIVSIVCIVYAALIGALFFVAHAALVASIRGIGVKLGRDQSPELQAAIERLARRPGDNGGWYVRTTLLDGWKFVHRCDCLLSGTLCGTLPVG